MSAAGLARSYPLRPLIGAGVALWRGDDVLLVRRAKAPLKGAWSLPGGTQKVGEAVRATALRELREETGLEAEIIGLIDVVDSIWPDDAGRIQYHHTLIDFAARMTGGTLKAGGDAAEAAFHAATELDSLGLWPETLRIARAGRAFFRP